jgi:mannosylglycoprotein endo-beta-mannosidase
LDENYTLALANAIFCRNDSFPVRYLGLSLGVNPSRLFTWKPVLSTIRAKLSTWKGKMSMVGMICLIKSVLSSLPLYYMSIYHMPKGIINVISSINHFFFMEW